MKKFNTPDISMPDISMPDVSLPDAPDMSGLAESVADLASHAADAISSAAGRVPGIEDYRASNRRRNVLITVGAIVAVLAIVAYLKQRSADDVANDTR